MKVLITGANGFVGMSLYSTLLKKGHFVRCAVRNDRKSLCFSKKADICPVGDIGRFTDWTQAMRGIDIAVHLASRVHIMGDLAVDPLEEYRKVNSEGTKKFAAAAANAGVRRVVFLSTAKVNGEQTMGQSFSENDNVCPVDPYSRSKHEAELVLYEIAKSTGMEVAVLRPPVVYGANVKANFLRLMEFVNNGTPLPLASINNRRSMIYLESLVGAIIKCIEHPKAANQTFLVSDGEDVSTPDLIRMIARAMGKQPRLIPLPSGVLKAVGKITGRTAEIERLTSSLQVDSTKIRKMLDWRPSHTLDEGIGKTVQWYMEKGRYN